MKNAMNGNGLSREIGLFSATILVIANMVGTGIFTTSGFIMAELGNPRALLLCWFCGGVFALCGALCYGELGARFPKAGGEYVFLRESFGKPVGFLSGWISLIVGFSAPIAAAAIAFGGYFFQAFSIPAGEKTVVGLFGVNLITLSPATFAAIGVICLFTLVHYHSLRMGSRVQNLLTLFKVFLVVAFLIAGFFSGNGSFNHLQATQTLSSPLSAEKFAIALIFVSFAYSGWNAAAYLGSEIIDPKRNIPRALFIGTAVVILLYLFLNLIYIYAVSPGEMIGVMEIGATAAIHLFGENVSRIFSGAVALGILSVLSAMVMTGPRIYYAMSKDGVFFPVFGKLNSAHKTPASSIFLQAAIAVVMVLSASFETLLIYIGFTLSLFASLTVIGLMRIRMMSLEEQKGYNTWGYPVTPLVFIGCNLWIILYSVKSRPVTALFGLATIGLGMVAYAFFERRQSRKSGLAQLKPVENKK
ncbi:MAG: amino acid permease [Desulfobacterales bacterium]|jgi:APA family basic amino acid/polyamine antiporter|nr:amino acid permease [Desulfobacterales bacterium]